MATATKGKALLVKAMLILLAMGVLSYGYLPQAYCSLEDKTVSYIYMSDSHKTVTKVIPSSDEGGYSMVDDRCQKGTEIGTWVPVKQAVRTENCPVRIIAYTDNGKYYCNDKGCINANLEFVNIEEVN